MNIFVSLSLLYTSRGRSEHLPSHLYPNLLSLPFFHLNINIPMCISDRSEHRPRRDAFQWELELASHLSRQSRRRDDRTSVWTKGEHDTVAVLVVIIGVIFVVGNDVVCVGRDEDTVVAWFVSVVRQPSEGHTNKKGQRE